MKNLFKYVGIVFSIMAVVFAAACSNSTNADTLTTTSAAALAGNNLGGTTPGSENDNKEAGYGLFADIDPALQGTYWTARDKGGSFLSLAFTGSTIIWGGSFGERFYDEFVDGPAGRNDSEYAWIADDGLAALRFAGDFLFEEKIVELFTYELDGKKLTITWVKGDEAGQSLTLVRLGGGAVLGDDIPNGDTADDDIPGTELGGDLDSAAVETSQAYDQFDSIIRMAVDPTTEDAMLAEPLGDMPKTTAFTVQQ